jgi:integrase
LRLRTLILLLVETGLRVGIEALPLKWSDIDFEDATIRITRSKTIAGQRVIPMTALCKSTLQKWLAATEGESEHVFFNPQNPAKHIMSVKTAWHSALRSAGLKPFAIYNCRHTFCTRLLATGIPDAIVDQLLGHSRRDVLSFYSARVTEYLRDAINKLEKLRASKENACQDWTVLKSRQITRGSNLVQ